jgi:hypothetical protein
MERCESGKKVIKKVIWEVQKGCHFGCPHALDVLVDPF